MTTRTCRQAGILNFGLAEWALSKDNTPQAVKLKVVGQSEKRSGFVQFKALPVLSSRGIGPIFTSLSKMVRRNFATALGGAHVDARPEAGCSRHT